ncbi:molybdopterin biosynthesis protein MoeB [Vibrio astriarenae]|nr:molybdopterin biosynthesis protein MoeB [Vibrio sp. C7]
MDILSNQEMMRYNRQIVLRDFDFEGQEALKQSSVLVLGAGGLGCASSQYLAAAGVGK